MSRRPSEDRAAARVGVFGLIGSGNRGNDASFEVVLDHLRAEHPAAAVSVMCPAGNGVADRYGVSTVALNWNRDEYRTATGWSALVTKAAGKLVDAARTLAWVRRQDLVVVPGMGVLEASLPVRPWGFPYSLLLVCGAGRLLGVPVALIAVGADVVRNRLTRRVLVTAARLAHRRSYRDAMTRDAMATMGLDVTRDPICPDLVFAIPRPSTAGAAENAVGVGVMEYRGGDDNRRDADRIRAAYLDVLLRFVTWLLEQGRDVRLLTGDDEDQLVADEIRAGVLRARPDLDPSRVVAEEIRTTGELLERISGVATVVGTRYHNVLCALRLAVPTMSIGYSPKHEALMERMGVGEFHQLAGSLDLDRLVAQFKELDGRRAEVRRALEARVQEQAEAVEAHLRSVFGGLDRS